MSYSKEEAQKYAKEKVKQLTGQLEAGIKDLFESGDFSKYLKMMSMKAFKKYSWNNCLLIFSQCPYASYVAGYKTWEKDFNRHPKKGEKAINILAPSKYKVKVKKKDENGNETDEEEEQERFSYKSIPVFDYSQTEGDPVPAFDTKLDEDIEDCDTLIDALLQISPVKIDFDGTISGNSTEKNGEIIINSSIHDQQLIKELTWRIGMAECKGTIDYNKSKAVSEGAAYIVCNYYGIDVADQSFVNLATWGKNKELPELKEVMKMVKENANTMIEKLDKILEI